MDEVKDEVLATTDVHSVALESSSESLSQDSNANESVALEPEQLNGKHLNRGYLRHEWASTVLYLQLNAPNARHDLYDQVAWAISAHHGKLGVTLRPHPKETAPSDGRVFARGVWHGDELPAMSLGENEQVAATTLDVESLLRFGQGSWTDRMAYLLRSPDHGPFRLGLLEALLRAADGRASAAERTISSPASVSDSERSS
jgi:CRISPR-associated endonuclease/helicase Cas3